MYGAIVVGTDGSETAARAVERAATVARHVGSRLIVVTASAPVGMTDDVAEEVLAYARDAVRRLGVEAETMVREGDPAAVIAAVASESGADLIVVGNVGMGKARRFRLGGVAEHVATRTPCDVLVAFTREERQPPSDDRPYHRIVVGTDGSSTATEAARKSFDLGMVFGIGVTVVYVAGDPIVGAIVLERAKASKPRALGVETNLVKGEPAEQIVRVARESDADLIVVGNKGIGGARRVLLGSVPSQVAHAAPTDVLIAKTVERSIDDLTPGHGGVVDVEGRKLAVYMKDDGTMVALSPRCQHMGCTVDWNDPERTWDCPCHGSRYAADGTVIQGPATKDLDPAEIARRS
jgi:nucleotide-binding universal stress UspA family protein/nitrite reductase/ring-hydroxylating ferredoxin subunit